SLNFSSACGSCALTSGWSSRASARNAFLISCSDASRLTPSTSYASRGIAVASALGVRVFDEARELVRGLSHGHDRAGVVHANRTDDGNGAELAPRDAVAGCDECERAQRGH